MYSKNLRAALKIMANRAAEWDSYDEAVAMMVQFGVPKEDAEYYVQRPDEK